MHKIRWSIYAKCAYAWYSLLELEKTPRIWKMFYCNAHRTLCAVIVSFIHWSPPFVQTSPPMKPWSISKWARSLLRTAQSRFHCNDNTMTTHYCTSISPLHSNSDDQSSAIRSCMDGTRLVWPFPVSRREQNTCGLRPSYPGGEGVGWASSWDVYI